MKLQESITGEFEIHGHDYKTVNEMVNYMYTGDYVVPPDPEDSVLESPAFLFHIKMVALAEQYLISPLMNTARTRALSSLKKISDPSAIIAAIPALYELDFEGAEGMRARVAQCIRSLWECSGLEEAGLALFEQAALDVPQFAVDLIKINFSRDYISELFKSDW